MKDADGKVIGFYGMVRDISERKRAEEELRSSERRLADIINFLPDPTFVIDREGKVIAWNRALEDLTGVKPEDMLGKGDYEHAIPFYGFRRPVLADLVLDWNEEIAKTYEYVKKDGETMVSETHNPPFRSEPSLFWNTARPLHNARGDVVGAIEVIREITDRMLAEEALRASEQRFRELAELLPETVLETDVGGNLTFVNRRTLDYFGYTQEDFDRGMSAFDIIAPEDRERIEEAGREVLRGKVVGLGEYLALRKDGTTFPVLVHAAARVNEGKPAGLRGLIVDISEKKILEQQLQHAQKMESIGTIASGVAHNFRNVLTGISMNSQLIELKFRDNPELLELSSRFDVAVKRGARLVEGLMQFSRKETAKKFKIFDLGTMIHEIYELIYKSFDKKIEIQTECQESIPVLGSYSSLSQVLMNLCTNARDAMPDGGELRIVARRLEGKAELSISDTGHGMNEDAKERCFDPFFTTREVGKGTGLGLSTAYGIIKEHGGDIRLDSEVGRGSVFKIYLPIARQHRQAAKRSVDPRTTQGKGQKILVVDDENEILQPLGQVLESLGYRPELAVNGEEALAKYVSWQPDAVLIDRNMPTMDGITCAEKIIEMDQGARIILVSGYEENGPDGIDSHIKEIIKGYITKPPTASELDQVLGRVFDD
jgi:PAS domain S-box-containing protein